MSLSIHRETESTGQLLFSETPFRGGKKNNERGKEKAASVDDSFGGPPGKGRRGTGERNDWVRAPGCLLHHSYILSCLGGPACRLTPSSVNNTP